MPDEPIFRYDLLSYHVRLYPNRLEIEQRVLLIDSKKVIPLRNITEIKRPFGQRMEIHTNDRKKTVLNIVGPAADELERLLQENM